jgi:DNA-binding MarR family transcriptional regulator
MIWAYAGKIPRMTGDRRLETDELAAFFTLMEVSSTLQHAVEQRLRADGGLSCVQFLILARLSESPGGQSRMTDLADLVVYSRSALTYQATLMEKAGFITRSPSPDDERSTTVTITEAGRERIAKVLPGHIDTLRRMLLRPLTSPDVAAMTEILGRVRDSMRKGPPRSAASRSRRSSRPGRSVGAETT